MSYYLSKYGSEPENSYLYGSSQEPEQMGSMASQLPQGEAGGDGGVGAANLGSAAASGAAMGGPAGAGIAVGGTFLTNYLAQRAADERQRQKQAVENARAYGSEQKNSLSNLMNVYKGALR